jgi:hypothetical protein
VDRLVRSLAEDMVMDEQLAGHIEGLCLRPMMAGMGAPTRVSECT